MGVKRNSRAKFEVLMAITMNIVWDVTLYSLVEIYQRFGLSCHLHFKGKRIQVFITNHCTTILFYSYMFRLPVVAIIRESPFTDMRSV
jgi:hypothetical protein